MPCKAKLFEGLIRSRCISYLKKQNIVFLCKQQQGFQEQLSCNTAAFNLQETVYYNIEHRSKTWVAYLDINGAFDTVWHEGLLLKLGQLGIVGKMWRILKASYQNLKCVVRANGVTSQPVNVERGVRQGGRDVNFLVLSLYKRLARAIRKFSIWYQHFKHQRW